MFRLVALVVSALGLIALSAPAAQAANLEVERFIATNCKTAFEHCGSKEVAGPLGTPYSIVNKEVTVEEAHEQGFTEAGGRVPNGVTDFKVKTVGNLPDEAPTAIVNHVRVDVAPGLATAPAAVPTCSEAEFGNKEAFPGFYEEPKCKSETEIGTEQDTVWLGPDAEGTLGFSDLTSGRQGL